MSASPTPTPAPAGPLAATADPFDVRRVLHATPLLRAFNEAGVLSAADVHVARRLTRLAAETDEDVALAVALAVRGPRLGHVCVDLTTIRETATVDAEEAVDVGALPWPEPAGWVARLERSALVGGPLRLEGTTLYLDRYWAEEEQVAADLLKLGATAADAVRDDVLAAGLARLFADHPDPDQQAACETAVRRRLTVIAGGPGTGKTTTIARIVALLAEQAAAAGAPTPLVALAAPTGKAAARMEEAVHEVAASLDVAPEVRAQLLESTASTLHRLLGWRPGSHGRFRHHRANKLPHDVVIVDETSMVSLSLMARLVEAIRTDARLVLVGDPGQLTSVEAGAVLGDIVGPRGARTGPVGGGIVVLDRVHRFGEGIATLADAIRRGDADGTITALAAAPDGVTWIAEDAADADPRALALVRDGAVDAGRAIVDAARAGDGRGALDGLGAFRVLCAHRRGAHGVATWQERIESWLAGEIEGFGTEGRWYPGRPLMVTENDYALRLYNGDNGVVVRTAEDTVRAAFERRGGIVELTPSRLGSVETVYAMTVHKAQGSQFDTAAVLLPAPTSQILTRELLYTAVTRAKKRLVVVGTEATIREAVERPVARASGLERRLSAAETD